MQETVMKEVDTAKRDKWKAPLKVNGSVLNNKDKIRLHGIQWPKNTNIR